MGIQDEVERLQREKRDAAKEAVDSRRRAAELAREGQRRLESLGREMADELAGSEVAVLVRASFTPKRTTKGLFKVQLSDERVWDLGSIVVTRDGRVCWARDVWRPGGVMPYSPQSRLRSTRIWQEHLRQADEISELKGLLRRAQAGGIYTSLNEVTVSGAPPSGMVNREDERYDIWYDGVDIRHGTESHDTSYSELLVTATATAIVEAANRPWA